MAEEQKDSETKERLLACAKKEFVEKGYAKASLCTDPQMLDQKSNDWRSIFLWLNIVLNLKRK